MTIAEPAHDMSALMSGLALEVQHRRLDALLPYARNARTHNDEQVALIAGSIRLALQIAVTRPWSPA